MILYKNNYTIYFGNASDEIYPHEYQTPSKGEKLLATTKIAAIKKKLSIENLLFLRQVHSKEGVVVHKNEKNYRSFVQEGDFIITNQAGLGVGIFSADCLPIIVYDAQSHVAGIAHAGWKGSVQHIVHCMITAMQKYFSINLYMLSIHFGPHARSCCYEVSHNFVQNIKINRFSEDSIRVKNNRYFFDLETYTYNQFYTLGIPDQSIIKNSNCTICNDSYYSFRRQGIQAGRQPSIITLL